jgi:transcriptional regulator with XRE-family HTH domain
MKLDLTPNALLGHYLGMTLLEYLRFTQQSRADFAKRIGMSKGGFDKWVNGQRIPDSNGMKLLLKATHLLVTPNDFFPECRSSHREAAE